VGENESRSCLGGHALEVGAVPSRNRGREEARGGAEFRVGVETNTKAVCIILATSRILQSRQPQLAIGSCIGVCGW
jgi:hypothetical protein